MKKNLLLASALMLVFTFLTLAPVANAQDCGGVPGFVKDALKKLQEQCKQAEGSDASVQECADKPSVFQSLLKGWNSIIGRNTSAQIGPRQFDFGKKQTGTLVSPGNRTFFSQPLDTEGVEISIKKRDVGQASAQITVCKVDANGTQTRLDTFTIKSDAPVGTTVTRSYSGLKGLVVQMFMDGQGGLGRRLPVEILANKK